MSYAHRTFSWIAFTCSALSLQCTSPNEPNMFAYFYTLETPVVTGIHVTTLDMPDGTGQTIGLPSYSVSPNSVNVFPNPFVEAEVYPLLLGQSYIVFNHMPTKATVVIVKGRLPEESVPLATSYFSTTLPSPRAKIVRTLSKDDFSRFLRWDLKDDNGTPTPTGGYRAFYYGPSLEGIKFVDISVTRTPIRLDRY